MLDDLPELPASDVKRRGWKGVMSEVRAQGGVVVTNHATPEAVVLPAAEYVRLREAARRGEQQGEAQLDLLRQEFDERLASLDAPDAPARLARAMDTPVRLHGRVKAGTGH
jgi:prevent-host-death family protein